MLVTLTRENALDNGLLQNPLCNIPSGPYVDAYFLRNRTVPVPILAVAEQDFALKPSRVMLQIALYSKVVLRRVESVASKSWCKPIIILS